MAQCAIGDIHSIGKYRWCACLYFILSREHVGQFAKPLTTKDTKVHEGNTLDQKPSWYFVALVVQAFQGCVVKLTKLPDSSISCKKGDTLRRLRMPVNIQI